MERSWSFAFVGLYQFRWSVCVCVQRGNSWGWLFRATQMPTAEWKSLPETVLGALEDML